MANFVLPIVARTRRGFPAWVDGQIALGHKIALASDASIAASAKDNLLLLGARGNYWSYFPIATGLPVNNIEVLLKLSKSSLGIENYNNSGGAIMLSPTKDTGFNNGYTLCLGSGNVSTCSIYDRTLSGSQKQLGVASISPSIASTSAVILVRIRRDNDNIRMKVWHDGSSEPPDWSTSTKDTTYNVSNIGFIIHGGDLIINLKNISYATNGDTASFDLPPVVDVMAGTVLGVKNGDIINIHDLATHDIVDSIILPSSGAWASNLYNDRPVYARVERASGSEYDLLFAKYGGAYLGGDYPDGSVKDGGVPSAAEVSVLYRSDDPILGGATIAKVLTPPSGEWRVSGIQPDVPFDVVARKPNRKDVVVSGVVGVPDPDFKFTIMGNISYSNRYLNGSLIAKGAVTPLVATFTGVTPYGLNDDGITIDKNIIDIKAPMRDYGSFNFGLSITDSNNNTKVEPVSIINADREEFVDIVSTVSTTDSAFNLTQINIIIPTNIQAGDLLVLSVASHAKTTTITDDSGQTWVLQGSSIKESVNPMRASIYTRQAIIGDAGRVLLLKNSAAAVLIACLLVLRGRFSQLKVTKAIANDAQYNGNYLVLTKPLTPIIHQSGFIVRAVSSWSSSADASANKEITGMTNVLPKKGIPSRLQVAYKHEGSPKTLSDITFVSDGNSADNTVPDMVVIVDEARS